jgi:hypothetical protein
MKKLVVLTWLILWVAPAFTQNYAIDKLFEKYSGKEGYTSVVISSKMFDLFSEMQTDDPEFQNVIKGLKSIKILATDETWKEQGKVNFYNEIINELPMSQYEELMVVKEKDQDVKFLVREEGGQIVELLLIVGGTEENALISIQGIIDLKSISKLSKAMNIEGLENLEKIDESKK